MGNEVIDAVNELLPAIAGRAEQTEAEGAVSAHMLADLVSSGMLRMLKPRTSGGGEADPVDFFTVVRAIAGACPSTGWVSSLLGITPWHAALFDQAAQDDVWHDDPDTMITCSYAPTGRLLPVEDGYRLTGKWKAAPAADHCAWSILGSLVIGERGEPTDYAAVLVPHADAELGEEWNVLGMRGAGSRDVIVRDTFVPAHRVYSSAARQAVETAHRTGALPALYRIPYASIHSTALMAPIVGAAEGAYDYHLRRMQGRSDLSYGGRTVAEDGFAHVAVSRGACEIDASVLQMNRNLEEQLRHAVSGEPIPMELRLRARRDQVRGVERAVEALAGLVRAAGGHAVQMSGPIQRAWRDAQTGSAHLVNHVEHGLALFGRWAYGLGVDDSLILV